MKLTPLKIGGISAVSNELARSSDPVSELVVRASFEAAAISGTDKAFLNPTIAPVAGVSPGSVTFGAPIIAATATSHEAILSAFREMMDEITTDFIAPVFVCTPRTAISLSFVTTASSGLAFPFITARGGTIQGVPVITSSSAPSDSLVFLDGGTLVFGDDGIEFDASKYATVVMDDAPSGSGVMSSYFQENQIGYRLIRRINWARSQDGGVATLTGIVGP